MFELFCNIFFQDRSKVAHCSHTISHYLLLIKSIPASFSLTPAIVAQGVHQCSCTLTIAKAIGLFLLTTCPRLKQVLPTSVDVVLCSIPMFENMIAPKTGEPWSSGYGRRLTFQRSWVRIPAPDTGLRWHFFTLICCKNCVVCLKRPKIKWKRGRGWPNFFRLGIKLWLARLAIVMTTLLKYTWLSCPLSMYSLCSFFLQLLLFLVQIWAFLLLLLASPHLKFL